MKLVPYRNKRNLFPVMSLFDDFFKDDFYSEIDQSSRSMTLDINEKDEMYEVKANLPGFSKENVNILLDENTLTIEAKIDKENKEENKKYVRRERFLGNYNRSINLSNNCNVEEIKAKMENGVLTLNIPKTEPKQKKEITIN